ncbi:hypothetical protein MMC07_001181 [Pseudocyphellaria aurata]|nr:hypothetical protein [Pseudocyphellaria aurata]
MDSEDGRTLHAFFAPRNGFASNSDKLDVFGGRRKRQRTASPDHRSGPTKDVARCASSSGWEDQLKAAASGRHPPSLQSIPQLASLPQPKVEVVTINGGKNLPNCGGHGGTDRAVSHETESDTSGKNDAELSPDLASTELAATTSQKKMLTIRSDGKLLSPKLSSINANSKSKSKKGTKKTETAHKRKILVIKYGLESGSRVSLGQQIQKICSRNPSNSMSETKLDLNVPKSLIPPKTHPFFLGASRRTSNQKPVQYIDSKETSRENTTHTQPDAGQNPRKPNASARLSTNASAWANISGFGGSTDRLENSKVSRIPGIVDPMWPSRDMIHVRPQIEDTAMSQVLHKPARLQDGGRKMKYAKVQISEHEEVLQPYLDLSHAEREALANSEIRSTGSFRRPRRMILTGLELQNAIRENVASELPQPDPQPIDRLEEDELSGSHPFPSPIHGAILRVYQDIPKSLTAFDKFECETQDWVHKYAPKRAEEVLQSGREALILRDWLKNLRVTAVENRFGDVSKAHHSSMAPGKVRGLLKRKKRKRAEGLDDFLISSDEESYLTDDFIPLEAIEADAQQSFPFKRSVVQAGFASGNVLSTQRTANAVVISGPNGCGKTAAVYAVAHELGFEVFEINAGSRRSGRDVLDKVGDMTQNHLVNHASERDGKHGDEESLELSEILEHGIDSSRQATVNSFFKPKDESQRKSKCTPRHTPGTTTINHVKRHQRSQKQSLILLEEVDVLFEEDRQFWATILELITSSKRPVIMTCTDESLLPLDEMLLFAILRFTAPPEQLAIDYLLLVACNEGHLLSRSAVSILLKSKRYDLRASMTELSFFCQMALGDTKGGLEWMLMRSSLNESQNEHGQTLRVVSDATYLDGMGCFSNESPVQDERLAFNGEMDLLAQIRNCLSVDVAELEDFRSARFITCASDESQQDVPARLSTLEKALDAISAADTFPCSELRDGNKARLDTTLPPLGEKSKVNFDDGSILLEADPVVDHSGISVSLGLALRLCARRILSSEGAGMRTAALNRDFGSRVIAGENQNLCIRKQNTRCTLNAAVHPIARPLKLSPAMQKGAYISSFDGPTSILVEDLVPYVRSIVTYDVRLEDQRNQLNLSLSHGGRNGKRIRTTRASRAALEGGNKQHTRRERWFPSNTDFSRILESGGIGWQDALWQSGQLQSDMELGDDSSRRSSSADMMSIGS